MTTPIFKHHDDDGDLSLFASGNTLLVVCEEGHAWTLPATQVDSPREDRERVRKLLPKAVAQRVFDL